jgi:hypothetical protein
MNGEPASLFRAVRGPILLIALGTLFALDHFTEFRFRQTWPLLLILLGILILAERFITSRNGPSEPPAIPYPRSGGGV